MTNLSSECLASINKINLLISDKSFAVKQAIQETYTKDISMLEYGNNIITEGVLDSIPDMESDEGIWKSIVWFIPRLIKSIVTAIQNLWNIVRGFFMTKEQKMLWETAHKTPAERLKSFVNDDRFDAEDGDGGVTKLYIKTHLIDIDSIGDYVTNMNNLFMFWMNEINSVSFDTATEDDIRKLFTELSSGDMVGRTDFQAIFNKSYSPTPELVLFDESTYYETLAITKTAIENALGNLKVIGESIESWYETSVHSNWDSDLKRLASEFRQHFTEHLKDFQQNNVKIIDEIKENQFVLQIILNGLTEARKQSGILDALAKR